ncbi:MAG: tRNA uracil 4-sulfurtransferase ThiI [Clostridiales bacterium]|jgi:thiamine biosynthesis protein ThiI|nr:tRNA 4-thiouridine(8) synthase ThiI [Eubacteriales bacterium]MDH7565134.1 tRNA uracil 4-sulfurtransferase ThiI [Clostridiales bacterium]
MKRIILVRYGEIILKGLNRPVFEGKLVNNIKKSLYGLGKVEVVKSQGRIYVEPLGEDYEFDRAIAKLTRVFGVVSVSPVWKINSSFDDIKFHSLEVAKDLLERNRFKTFKVETKRGNKRFPMESPEISRELGAHILENIPSLSVDVIHPDFILYVEVREFTYIYSEIIPANGGMPIGTNGKAVLLLSGGIDSPVAGWMIAKRGVEIEAVHFYSYPYTSERAKEKVIELTRILSSYCGPINLHIVPFTDIQLEINEKCPQDQLTIIMRRAMMVISERIARAVGALALVTGESVGQVASQTIQSLAVTNAAVSMPVFRPLIGMDKNDVIAIARRIDTFETSILPYEDCCTVFVAKHPKTKPQLAKILLSESRLDMELLISKAVENTEVIKITPGKN